MHAQLSPEPARIRPRRTRSAWRWCLLASAVPLLPLELAAQSRAGESAPIRLAPEGTERPRAAARDRTTTASAVRATEAALVRATEAALVRATVITAAPLAEMRVLPGSSSAASSAGFPAVYLRLDAPAVVTVGDATLRATRPEVELRIPAPADGTRAVRIRIET